MSKWLAWLWKRRAANARIPLAAAPTAPEWTSENARDLSQFLRSETGAALLARMRAVEYQVSLQCVRDASAGQLKVPTFSDAIQWLESLSQAGGDSPASFSPPTGETGEAEPQLAIA